MASLVECRNALDRLARNLAGASGPVRRAAAVDRSLSCHIRDLDRTFTGRLRHGTITIDQAADAAIHGQPAERAQIRLAMTGDDLVALVDGRLNFAVAWGSGRISFHASFGDLLRLRSLL
jgi:hypothetical protein